MTQRIRTGIIGSGLMARSHIRRMVQTETDITAISEPSVAQYQATVDLLQANKLPTPPNEPDFERFVEQYAPELDAVLICTPHANHFHQAKTCLEAGLDVFLEKPMVTTANEAIDLIETRDRTGKLLVVAFQGGLSPQVRTAVKMLRSGELGEMLNISGTVWQNWKLLSDNTWRVIPELSGGGFLFDTGAHILNTICDLAGEDFETVAAWTDNRGMAVDICGVIIGRLESGGMVTINACGDTIPVCASEIKVFCTEGIIRTGMWGERLLLQKPDDEDFEPVQVTPSIGAWEQFLLVRAGTIENPSPPEVGLRMSLLWDSIKASASQGGVPVQCKTLLST